MIFQMNLELFSFIWTAFDVAFAGILPAVSQPSQDIPFSLLATSGICMQDQCSTEVINFNSGKNKTFDLADYPDYGAKATGALVGVGPGKMHTNMFKHAQTCSNVVKTCSSTYGWVHART